MNDIKSLKPYNDVTSFIHNENSDNNLITSQNDFNEDEANLSKSDSQTTIILSVNLNLEAPTDTMDNEIPQDLEEDVSSLAYISDPSPNLTQCINECAANGNSQRLEEFTKDFPLSDIYYLKEENLAQGKNIEKSLIMDDDLNVGYKSCLEVKNRKKYGPRLKLDLVDRRNKRVTVNTLSLSTYNLRKRPSRGKDNVCVGLKRMKLKKTGKVGRPKSKICSKKNERKRYKLVKKRAISFKKNKPKFIRGIKRNQR